MPGKIAKMRTGAVKKISGSKGPQLCGAARCRNLGPKHAPTVMPTLSQSSIHDSVDGFVISKDCMSCQGRDFSSSATWIQLHKIICLVAVSSQLL